MECLTRCFAGIWDEASVGPFAVDRVATQQVTGLGEVDSDLVCSTGFKLTFDEAVRADFFDRLEMSDGALFGWVGFRGGRRLCTAMAVASVSNEDRIDGSRFRVPVDNSVVFPNDSVVFESLDQGSCDALSASKEHQATSVAIQSMHSDDT
jgi:hypothetical protein